MRDKRPEILPIFRSRHQLALLGALYINAGKSFSIADLARANRIPQATVSREVSRLAKAGLVNTRTVGRNKLVQANGASSFFADLQSLLLKAMGPVPVLAQLLESVEGVEEAYVFGSWARRYRGESGPVPADIDLLVVGDPDVDEIDSVSRRGGDRLGLEVNAVVLSRDEWESAEAGFARSVRTNPLIPLGGAHE